MHAVRNEDAAMLASADLEATHLRRGVLDALDVFALDVFALDLPCEACLRMAAKLRAALAAAELSTSAGSDSG